MLSSVACFLIATSICVVPSTAYSGHGEFNYDRDDMIWGPNGWAKQYPECNGSRNSPINFQSSHVFKASIRERWGLDGWITPQTFDIHDLEHAVKWSVADGSHFSTEGGAMGSKYTLVQFHIHWATDDSKGSEHRVNGKKYPMEMHFVHMRSDFDDISVAVASGDSDALAVLAFFFEIDSADNPALAPIIDSVKRVRHAAGTEITGFVINDLKHMFEPQIEGPYYRYFGGLTTPGCNEVVQWTVFTQPIPVSAKQMELIRSEGDAHKGDFFRAPRPLNNRFVIEFE